MGAVRTRSSRWAATLVPVAALVVPLPLLMAGSPAGAVTPVAATVTEGATGQPVPSDYAGFSIDPANLCDVVSLASTDPAFVQLFKDVGPGILRVGGNTGDVDATWSTTGTASCAWNDLVVTPALVDSFFSFAQSVGYRVMWQVPLGNGALAADAAEAAYVSGKTGVDAIEIGNEPDLYTGAPSVNATTIANWKTVYADYRSDGGTAPVTGPSVSNSKAAYLSPFLTQAGTDLSALTGHFYAGTAATNPTCGGLLGSLSATGRIRTALANYSSAATTAHLPFVMNETNTYYHYGMPGVSNAYCSALWTADYTMIGLESGLHGIYFHGTADYAPGNTNGVVQYYTPINSDGTPAPEYYGLLFTHWMTRAGGSVVQTTETGAAALDTSAVLGSDKRLRVALVNHGATPVTATVTTTQSYTSASKVALIGPSLGALTGVTFGGNAVGAGGGWSAKTQPEPVTGTTSTVVVAAHAAAVVTYVP